MTIAEYERIQAAHDRERELRQQSSHRRMAREMTRLYEIEHSGEYEDERSETQESHD